MLWGYTLATYEISNHVCTCVYVYVGVIPRDSSREPDAWWEPYTIGLLPREVGDTNGNFARHAIFCYNYNVSVCRCLLTFQWTWFLTIIVCIYIHTCIIYMDHILYTFILDDCDIYITILILYDFKYILLKL